MSASSGPQARLKSLLKSFSEGHATRTTGKSKTDTNKLMQLSGFIEYLQQLRSEDILSISKQLEEGLLSTIIPHPQVSNLVYRDLVSQICVLNFRVNMSKLRDFYISLQTQLQTTKANTLRLTVLHVMGVLAANNPMLSQFLNETCGILLKTAKSSSISVRIAIVDTVKNCIIGAQQGIRYAISDLMKLCEKISRDRDSRVRVALSAVILLVSHYYPDNLKEYISLIRKQCTVKHHNVRHAFGDILGKILARTIPADIEMAKREKRRLQQQREQKEAAQATANKSKKGGIVINAIPSMISGVAKGNNSSNVDDDADYSDDDNDGGGGGGGKNGKDDDSSLAKSIIDFESGFFAALTLFDKLRNSTSGASKNSAWFGLTAGTQLLMSFLKECMLLSRFESTHLSYVVKQILKKLKTSHSLKDGKKSIRKMIIKGASGVTAPSSQNDSQSDIDDGIVSCMSYVLRFGLFTYLDESSQSKAVKVLCDFISGPESGANAAHKKRTRTQIYLCLNEVGYILHSLQCGCCEQSQINDIFLMCLRFTTHTSHAIRNRSAQCLALCAVCNADQVFVWADGLIKEISATLSTIDSSDPSRMYLLHGRSIALAEIIKIIPQLKHGVPDTVASKAFSVAVDLFNVDIQEDVSFNLEASSILTVCGWVLVDALIHLGTSWANSKIKTLLNIWRDVFSQTTFSPSTSSEAISLIYVKQAAYHSMLTFVRVFEKQIPIHPDLQQQIVKRLQHALDFEKFINTMMHDTKKQHEQILTPAVRHQLSRLRSIMMNIFAFLPPTIYERHVTLLKLANANFSHRKAVTSNELEHLLDYEDDILCNTVESADMSHTLVSRSCSQLNVFIEYISNPTIDELGLDKSWMPQDLMHSILFQLGVMHDKHAINVHKSTRITAMLADINDATHFDGSPAQISSLSPHLSYTHYTSSSSATSVSAVSVSTVLTSTDGGVTRSSSSSGSSGSRSAGSGGGSGEDASVATLMNSYNEVKVLRSMTIGGIMMNEDDIAISLQPPSVTAHDDMCDDAQWFQRLEDDKKEQSNAEKDKKKDKETAQKEFVSRAKQRYHRKILHTLEMAQMEQSMRLIPRLTMSYFQKENCDANLRLFCKLFPFQNEQHKLKLVQHFVEVAKDAKQSEKSESLKIVLQNSAAVILGCCKCMLENGIQFGKGKVRDSVLRIASDFLAFNNQLVMRAGAQVFGILSRIEDDAFKTTIIQYLYKKKFGEEKCNVRAASALALGCIHQYSGSKENLGFTVAALQLLERDGEVSLWLLHSLQRILQVVNNPSPLHVYRQQNARTKLTTAQEKKREDDDEAICRNILGFTLSILADEKDCVDCRVLNALLEILNILLSRIVKKSQQQKLLLQKKLPTVAAVAVADDSNQDLLNMIIFMLKFIERLNIPELHSKLLECASKIAQCSPHSIVNLDSNDKHAAAAAAAASSKNNDALDAQQYIIHQLQRCLFSGNLREKVSAMDAIHTFAKHSPSILVSKNILHSLLYLLDVNATVPIIYHRALSALRAVTDIYGQKYPQSLIGYFKAISLRGMQIKPPEIEQIISLMAQDLAIKKITKCKSKDNEWVIIPPSLNQLRYTTLLYIQFVIHSMISYAVRQGESYTNVTRARKQLAIMEAKNDDEAGNGHDGDNRRLADGDAADHEFISLSMGDLVQLVCKDAASKYAIVRHKSLQCLHAVIVHFSTQPDPDAGIEGEFLLNQFRAQIDAALRGILSSESDPMNRFLAAELAVDYMNCPLATEEVIGKNFHALFQIFEDNSGKHYRHLCSVFEAHVRTVIILQHLKAICLLYNRVFYKDKDERRIIPFVKNLKILFLAKLVLMKQLIEKALMDYVVVTSSTRKSIRDYNGNFFVGQSYRRVRQIYIGTFALLLRTLARLVSSSTFKKTVDVALQLIEPRVAITLFATSLYCLQDCLIHFDDTNQQNELPLVQSACVDLLSTLTSTQYLSPSLIDQDMLYDFLTMIHGGIQHQITRNTLQFEWDQDLAMLLLNCVNSVLSVDLAVASNPDSSMSSVTAASFDLSKLVHVAVNCWIDPINAILTYITTSYDDSPYWQQQQQQQNQSPSPAPQQPQKSSKVSMTIETAMLRSLFELVESIGKYNLKKAEEQEIDCQQWALPLSDWCNAVTAISMLISTAYKLSPTQYQSQVEKSLVFTAEHNMLCVQLLDSLLAFELYTKPDPNNPNFNLNCLRARGCIAENIKYLSQSLPTNQQQQPQQQNGASKNNSVDQSEYYALVVRIMYKLAHCAMNVEITEEQQDSDEKLNDRQCIESVETLRQFILLNIHNTQSQKFILQALNASWSDLLRKIEDEDEQTLTTSVERKYSSINIQIESMLVVLPHIVMMVSKNASLYSKDVVQCLLCVLQIFDAIEPVSSQFQAKKSSQQIYSVIIPMLVKLVIDPEITNTNMDELKDLVYSFIAQNLAANANLLETIKSLPRTIVAHIQQQLSSYDTSGSGKTPKKSRKAHKGKASENTANSKDDADENEEAKSKKSKNKKDKKKKKKKKKKALPQQDENNDIDFGAFA